MKSKQPEVKAMVESYGSRPFTIQTIASKTGVSYATTRKVVLSMLDGGEVAAIGESRKPKRGKAAIRYQLNGKHPYVANPKGRATKGRRPKVKSVKSRRSPLDRALALAEADLDRAQSLVDSLRQAKRLEKQA